MDDLPALGIGTLVGPWKPLLEGVMRPVVEPGPRTACEEEGLETSWGRREG